MRSSKNKSGKRRYKRERGAISIFLVIILVPCIALSSICVDLSRVQLSKAVAVSSADLALNTLLTNYDGDLNDWYGMIGSCQDIQSYYETAAGYFDRAMSSKGLSDNEILLLSDVAANAFGGEKKIHDLLQVSTVEKASIEEVKDANLSNPTLIKDQIVEFMKYRAPIELTLGIIETLKKDSSVGDTLNAEENEPLVEKKEDFYEAEGELLTAAYNSYKAIRKYVDKVNQIQLTNDKLLEYSGKINDQRAAYEAIHTIAVSNLLNTEKLTGTYSRKTTNIANYTNIRTRDVREVSSSEEEDEETGDVTYYITDNKLSNLVTKAENAITNFDNAKTAYVNNVSSIMSTLPGSGDVNSIQWWVRIQKAVYVTSGDLHGKLSSAADQMMEHIRKLSAALECEPDPDRPPASQTYTDCNNALNSIRTRYTKYLSGSASESDSYVKAANTFARVSNDNIQNVKSNLVKVTVNGSSVTVDSAIQNAGNSLTAIYTELVSVRDLLNTAIDGDGKDVPSLSTLEDLAEKYNTEREAYESAAENSTTDMGKDERNYIEEQKAEKKISDGINKAGVTELKTRLTNIRSQINTVINAIESVKYGNKMVKDIKDFSTFRTEALRQVKKDQISLYNSSIQSYAASTFKNLYKPSGTAVTLKNTAGNSHNPMLNLPPKDPNLTATPELLVYFANQFKAVNDEKLQEKQQDQKDAKNKKDEAAKAAKDKGRYHGGGESIASSYSSGAEVSFLDGAFSSLVEVIEILGDLSKITKIRDDLYVTSYIMEMFSDATFEEEGLYDLIENKTELSLPDSTEKRHTPKEYDDVLGDEKTPGTWRSDSVEDPYNKTLTNKLINQNNNKAYGAEVEYILKGQKDNNENVKKVYQDIYAIRYPLNLVSGFINFWQKNNPTSIAINTVANAIAGATCGIIPAPVTKVLIIPILTVFETSKDMDRLEAGFPVELYKKVSEDWWIALPEVGLTEESLDTLLDAKFEKTNPDKGIFYSDYLTIFTYLGLKGSNKQQMYYRVAEVIESNMAKITKGSYKMSNVRMYFSLKATLRVKPMMVALPYYFDEYDNLMMTTTDWCTYKVSVVRGYS